MAPETRVQLCEAQRRLEHTPIDPIERPKEGPEIKAHQAIIDAFPIAGTERVHAHQYATILEGSTAKLVTRLPSSNIETFFLKIVTGENGESKCEGEFASPVAINQAYLGLATQPVAVGEYLKLKSREHFILEKFFNIGKQPADPAQLGLSLAALHRQSRPHTGTFGYHVKKWHGNIAQEVDQWCDSWATLFKRHLEHILGLAKPLVGSSELDVLCDLILEKVVPRLLDPLQENGRSLKPSLLHDDCWDGNTAIDADSRETRVLDAASFYGHNEYGIGNWRTPRHRVSGYEYIASYYTSMIVSEPAEDWTARNLLFSLCFNTSNLMNIPGSLRGETIMADMTMWCDMLWPHELEKAMADLSSLLDP